MESIWLYFESSGSSLHEHFNEVFEESSYHLTLSQFSQAQPLVDHMDPRLPKEKQLLLIDQLIWLLQQNALIQLHTFVYLMPRKVERVGSEHYSLKMSEMSLDEDTEVSIMSGRNAGFIGGAAGGAPGSEHSNDTENTDQKDMSALYEDYRDLFAQHHVTEKNQKLIFKAFEQKAEHDIKLFIQWIQFDDIDLIFNRFYKRWFVIEKALALLQWCLQHRGDYVLWKVEPLRPGHVLWQVQGSADDCRLWGSQSSHQNQFKNQLVARLLFDTTFSSLFKYFIRITLFASYLNDFRR